MFKISIPERFLRTLRENDINYSVVLDAKNTFEKVISEGNLEFFREYTNHGIQHINKVLELSDKLIPNETYKVLNSDDITMIILVSLLHDLGMHITFEGFEQLINGSYGTGKASLDDEKTWLELWKAYIEESKYWDGNKIVNIYGEETTPRIPPLNSDDANGKDRKFIGEFLRKHHPRLANYIAVYGFPGKNNTTIPFALKLSNPKKSLIGYIARSHGMNLWDALDYFNTKYQADQIRYFYNVHVLYLMVVLRISDYLDIDKTRADAIILNIRKLSSPISKLEWLKHGAVDYIEMDYQQDKESIYIHTNKVKNSKVYLGLINLLKSMQTELDICWAVLGKVYARFGSMDIKFRRLHSNLTDVKKIEEEYNFLPERVKFDSNDEILKLLIAPLYGDNPSFGVRELLQNSIDACLEKSTLKEQSDGLNKFKAIVDIEILKNQEDNYWFKIEDNGIGMSKDILINYFLKAGASFRKSQVWRSKFLDKDKNSKVRRSGRFGIGVFASFLIGNEISVSTSKFGSKYSYNFTASIDTEQIEVIRERFDRNESGTRIKIKLNDEILSELEEQYRSGTYSPNFYYSNSYNIPSWDDWYHGLSPEVKITVPEEWRNRIFEKKRYDLNLSVDDKDGWRKLEVEKFQKVVWTSKKKGNLFCNGIRIPQAFNYSWRNSRMETIDLIRPTISILDNDGLLPLNLDRNGLSEGKLPFEEKLIKDISIDIFANLIKSTDLTEYNTFGIIVKENSLKHPLIDEPSWRSKYNLNNIDIIFNKKGFFLNHHYNISRLENKIITKIWLENDIKRIEDNDFLSKLENFSITEYRINSIRDYKQIFDCINEDHYFGKIYKFSKLRVFMSAQKFEYLFDQDKNRLKKKSLTDEIRIEEKNDIWCIFSYGNPPKSSYSIDDLDYMNGKIKIMVEYFYKSPEIKSQNHNSNNIIDHIENLHSEYIGEEIYIPYDLMFRKIKLSNVFSELNYYFREDNA